MQMLERNIEELTQRILRLPQRQRIKAFRKINNTVDYFEDCQIAGHISERSLLSLIRRSYTSPSTAGFLASALYFVDSEVLTDEVFQKLLHFPWQKMRRTFPVAISHCPISVHQLEAICKLQICGEAYAQLLWSIATNPTSTLSDVQRTVAENRQFFHCIDYAELAKEEQIGETKRQYFSELADGY